VRDGRLLKLPYGVMEVIDGGPHDAHIPVAGGNGGGQFSIRGLDAGLECDPPGREARLNSLDTDALIGVKRQIAVNDGMQRGRRIAFLHPGAPAPRPPRAMAISARATVPATDFHPIDITDPPAARARMQQYELFGHPPACAVALT